MSNKKENKLMHEKDTFTKLHPGLQDLIKAKKGWRRGLTEIQVKAFPIIMAGSDCIIEAPTAGGKTEAVLFPTLTRASANKKNSVQVLFLAPLRALLNNIEKRAEEYAHACGIHAFKWHGDVSQKEKIDAFKNPYQLLLTTPESLEAILLRKSGWTKFFAGLEVVIIDEAHNFAAGDRGGHLISLLERLEKALAIPFQRIALTATLGNPEEMLKWLGGTNRKPGKRIHVSTNKPKEKDFLIRFFDAKLDKHKKEKYEEQSTFRELDEIYRLLPHKKTIIFEPSRASSEAMAAAIRKMNQYSDSKNHVQVRTHHSSVSKFYREEAEKLIKAASESGLHALISTATLELGIDIGELDQVIQVGRLASSSAFLQRVGRTGRREGKKQFFRGLCTLRRDLILLTAVVNLGLENISEAIRFQHKAYHLLAHQLLCLSLQYHGIQPEKAWEILSCVYCFSGISLERFKDLVRGMLEKKYLRDVDGALVVGEEGEKKFLGANWRKLFAVFDSAPMYEVLEGKKQIGSLDAAFVESLSVPFLFVLGGIEWEAERVNHKTKQVIAKRTKIGDAPKWMVGRGLDVPIETAKEAGRILFDNDYPDFLDEEARDGIDAERAKWSGIGWAKNRWVIVLSVSGNAEIWTFAGDKINRTLALLIKKEGIGKTGANYRRIEIKTEDSDRDKTKIRLTELLNDLKKTKGAQLEALEVSLSRTIRRTEFSKFTGCLPDILWSEAWAERSLAIEGLKNELSNIKIEFVTS